MRFSFLAGSALRGLLIASLLMVAAPGRANGDKEAAVRAAFLYRLAFFVAWPEHRFADANAPIRLCLGAGASAPLRAALDAAAQRRQVQQRPLQVLDYRPGAGCELLYVTGDDVPDGIADDQTLVVVDSADALRSAGQLALVRESSSSGETRLVFHGDRSRIGTASFTLSSKLLSLVRFDGD